MSRQISREPVDGIDTLRRRERTRLWYRVQPHPVEAMSSQDALANGKPRSAVRIIRARRLPDQVGTDQLLAETLPRTASLQKVLDDVAASEEKPRAAPAADPLTDWRDAPVHCPVLLLSASPLLDARNPGPILGPGTRYRVLSVNDGVVALEVTALDGHVGAGYCNSVDLTCFEPNIAHLRREGGARGRQTTARLTLNRISQRISGVTGALVG